MESLVSILIPAFNAERWIAQTIRSAIEQTWPRKEIIVVDDGSIDGTVAAAQQFASDSVTVVSQQNEGASAARNKAYSLCRGDYIQWLDADDLLAPDKISCQMKAAARFQDKTTLFSSAWGHFFQQPDRAQFKPNALWADLNPRTWLITSLGQEFFMQPATWLISRELAEMAGPWDIRLSFDDDGEYNCRLVRSSSCVLFVPEGQVCYRRSGGGSLSRSDRKKRKLESEFLSMKLQVRHLLSLDDGPEARSACIKFLQRYLIDFYPERPDIVRELQALAESLDGKLDAPELPAKYAWIQKIFGWAAAKRVQVQYNRYKSSLIGTWEDMRFRLNI